MDGNGDLAQVPALDASAEIISESWKVIMEGEVESVFIFEDVEYYLLAGKIQDDKGLDWDLVTLHPTECEFGTNAETFECDDDEST